jgi:hypothetical protein
LFSLPVFSLQVSPSEEMPDDEEDEVSPLNATGGFSQEDLSPAADDVSGEPSPAGSELDEPVSAPFEVS